MALEPVLAAFLLVAALIPVGIVLFRRRGILATVVLCVAVLTGTAALMSAWGDLRSVTPPRPSQERFDGYVSSNACRACHVREYETWHASYHRTMTQYPTPETVLGDFDDPHLEHDGIRYSLSREGREFWVEWDDPKWNPQSSGPRTQRRQMVLLTGSHHDQMYWYASPGHGDALELFPFDYSRRLERWIPSVSSFLQPPDNPGVNSTIGQWNATCSNCHTVHPDVTWKEWEPPYTRASMESRVAELGIACEACHGPGRNHIERNRNPLRRYRGWAGAKESSAIAQPATLDSRRSAEVCGQCHGVWLAGSDSVTFVPGMDLTAQRVAVRTRYVDPGYRPADDADRERQRKVVASVKTGMDLKTLYWDDGQVRVSGREYTGMIESPCFERGSLTCVNCHTLHKANRDPRSLREWANDQVSEGMEGNRACLQCHPSYVGTRLVSHTRHSPGSPGSNCYNCHMPATVYGIQKAHRSHTVSSPSVRESIGAGRPNACNLCHLDRSLAWTGRVLSRWYAMPESLTAAGDSPVSAAVRWSLSGDAGQRALTAWAMGWEPARKASGAWGERDWMIPYLGQLLNDPYDSVRFIAYLALRTHPGFERFDYDFVGSSEERRTAAVRVRDEGSRDRDLAGVDGPAVLFDDGGNLLLARFEHLLAGRNDAPVRLAE